MSIVIRNTIVAMSALRRFALLLSACLLGPTISLAQDEPPLFEAVPREIDIADPVEEVKLEADQAYRQGQHARAIELAESVLKDRPEDHVALYLRASARVELGLQKRDPRMIRDGVADARESIRIEKSGRADYYLPYLFGMTNLAIVERKPAHAEMARSVADQVLEKDTYSNSDRANLTYQRGLANIQAQARDAAARDFNEAIRLQPDHLAAYVALCNLTNETRGPNEALNVYNRAIAMVPGNALLLNNRAMHLHAMGRSQESLADFAAALKIDPRYIPALINRAFVLSQTGKVDEAEADLTRTIELDPRAAQAYSLRGTLRTEQGRAKDAIADYRKVVELDPTNGTAAADLGFAYFFSNDFAKAVKQFQDAQRLNPDLDFLTPWRYAAGIRTGQDLSRDPTFRAVTTKDANKRTWFDWLTLHQMNRITDGELLAAAHPIDSAMRKAQLCEAFYFIGLERWRTKRPEDAKTFFNDALATDAQRLSAYRGATLGLQELNGAKSQ